MFLPTYICFLQSFVFSTILQSFSNLNFSEESTLLDTVQYWLWEPLLHTIIVTLSGRVRENYHN